MTGLRAQLPPYVYLPCTSRQDDVFEPDVRAVQSGTGLLVYTALDRLRRVHGDEREWVVVPITMLTRLREQMGFQALLLDDGLPEEERPRG